MCQKYCEGRVPTLESTEQSMDDVSGLIAEHWRKYHAAVSLRHIHEALAVAMDLVGYCNRTIEEKKPWVMAKDPEAVGDLNRLLYSLLEVLRQAALMLSPALIESSKRLEEVYFKGVSKDLWQGFAAGSVWGGLEAGSELGVEQTILFPRREA
jgi:methionyl-tRNA synthetase